MATGNSTSRLEPEILYFARPDNELGTEQLINALDGVCQSIYAWDGSTGDYDEVNRITNLAVAAAFITRQLQSRQTIKPVSKREKERARLAQCQLLAARGHLATAEKQA